jgi:hypothetical protein
MSAIEAWKIILKYFSDFTSEQLHQLKELEELYKNWNNKINVISGKILIAYMKSMYCIH